MANYFGLRATLTARYPGLEVISAAVGKREDGTTYQMVRYKGTKRQLLASGVATEKMFANHDTHWKKPHLTGCGCSYSLDNRSGDGAWWLMVHSEMTPKDGHGAVSFLSKGGLKEAGAILQRIFAGKEAAR